MNLAISYDLLGRVTVLVILMALFLLVIGLFLAYIVFKKKQIFFPRLILLVLDSLYIPSKRIVSFFNGDETMVDRVAVEIRNMLLKEKFLQVPYEQRLILLPQCLRNINCSTKLSPLEGSKCLKCGKCKIVEIVKKAEELHYIGVFIVPGGGFVKRIMKRFKPSAILGIACPYELNLSMMEFSSKIPGQGVLLSRTGCVETDIELEDVFEVMQMKK